MLAARRLAEPQPHHHLEEEHDAMARVDCLRLSAGAARLERLVENESSELARGVRARLVRELANQVGHPRADRLHPGVGH